MALHDKIEAVSKVDKASNKQPIEQEVERVPPNKEHFDSLMATEQSKEAVQKQRPQDSALTVEKAADNPSSIMDQVKKLNTKVNTISRLSPEDLKNQVRDVISQMDEVKTKLSSTTEINPSYRNLMQNRLTHVDDNLRVALSKAGVEYQSVAPPSGINNTQLNPLDRFLGLITHGQYQLEHISQTVSAMSENGKPLTAANMMALQIKVGQIQQEIELFTSLLNKFLESTKTLMNVQV
jgi:hypothetical protein